MQPPLILFVVNGHEYTAGHRLPLLHAAKANGYRVECVAPLGSPAYRRLSEDGWRCHGLPLSRRGLNIASEIRSIWLLVRIYRRMRPHIVHHATIKPVLYGSIAARIARLPSVLNAITGLGVSGFVHDTHSALAKCPQQLVVAESCHAHVLGGREISVVTCGFIVSDGCPVCFARRIGRDGRFEECSAHETRVLREPFEVLGRAGGLAFSLPKP